jgi:hypothetical protein
MTEQEWQTSNESGEMIRTLKQLYADDLLLLDRILQKYYLACCRAIWKLLPDEKSRQGIVVAERYLDRNASDDELDEADWYAEGAALAIEFKTHPQLQTWLTQVQTIPDEELRAMIHSPTALAGISSHELLKRAAYFASFAVGSPRSHGLGVPASSQFLFLSPQLLRECFGNPFARGDRVLP